ncbi:type II toxin-antitoxin system RelE/ParE family toxin [Leucobacter sp. 7(1)]|uniref:type II toxin-antitoxin system RelE/ParE family toxin n=1 Tax=Leucobacter sp. 7(1) TaxID=1255613 RepID=UPI000B34E47C|nr:type II toxin-antitoxin system RelE/ParE family toxin [Leucobacter sp. 7(1)]
MIVSFRHKGLEALYRSGSRNGVQSDHVPKLTRILSLLDVAQHARDLDRSGFRLHELKGELADQWSVRVGGNWRVTFRFVEQDVELVDYRDCH